MWGLLRDFRGKYFFSIGLLRKGSGLWVLMSCEGGLEPALFRAGQLASDNYLGQEVTKYTGRTYGEQARNHEAVVEVVFTNLGGT